MNRGTVYTYGNVPLEKKLKKLLNASGLKKQIQDIEHIRDLDGELGQAGPLTVINVE